MGLGKTIQRLVLCTIALAIAAVPALGQGSGKFEQVAPPKRQPSPSITKPPARASEPASPRSTDAVALTRELARKAIANEEEKGFCANANWREIGDWAAAMKQAVVGEPGPLTELFRSRAPIVFRATYQGSPLCGMVRADPDPAASGNECVLVNMWLCAPNRKCTTNSRRGCRDRHGYWQLQ